MSCFYYRESPLKFSNSGDIVRVDLDAEAVGSNFPGEVINLLIGESRKLIRFHSVQGEQSETESNHTDFVEVGVGVCVVISHN